ncbi:MAG TPA: hypothetical protein VGJ20_25260 [Xanthobacteraceae bacterium]|jgi:hypothetical protein
MNLKLASVLAGTALMALASGANAAQPLSDTQLDRVTAGAAATANAASLALGDFDATTLTQTTSNAVTSISSINQIGIAVGQSLSVATAASALFQAAVATHADSAATLP